MMGDNKMVTPAMLEAALQVVRLMGAIAPAPILLKNVYEAMEKRRVCDLAQQYLSE